MASGATFDGIVDDQIRHFRDWFAGEDCIAKNPEVDTLKVLDIAINITIWTI